MLLFSPFVNLLFRHCDKRQIIFLMILFAAFSLLPFVSFCGLGYNGLFWTPATYAVLCYMVGGCLTTYKKQKTLNLTKASATLLLVVSGCIGLSLLFLFILAAQQQVGIARFFSWPPRSILAQFR